MTWYAEQLNSAGKLTKAERVYQRAIELNPLYPPAWLGLAGLRDDTGDKEHANQLLDFIATKTKDVQRWAWNKNLLAYRFGRTDILAIELPYIINTVPGKTRDDAIRMAFSIWPTLAELREHLPDQMPALFNYAVRSGRLEQALIVWPTIATSKLEHIPQPLTVRFINMLITQKEWPIAKRAWQLLTQSGNGVVFNGSFQTPPLQGAFDWRISKIEGVSWEVITPADTVTHNKALHLYFSGQQNMHYRHVSQIIPIEGGQSYVVQGQWKGADLSTEQRPFLELLPYACEGKAVQSSMIGSDTHGWQDVQLEIQVPEGCQALLLRIGRKQSLQIDNRLRGDFWITGLQLTQLAE